MSKLIQLTLFSIAAISIEALRLEHHEEEHPYVYEYDKAVEDL